MYYHAYMELSDREFVILCNSTFFMLVRLLVHFMTFKDQLFSVDFFATKRCEEYFL